MTKELEKLRAIQPPPLDQSAVRAAAEGAEAARGRLAKARADLDAAEVEARAAVNRYQAAVKAIGAGADDATEKAEADIQAADARVLVLLRRVAALEEATQEQQAAQHRAFVATYAGQWAAGVRIRIEAARIADAARETLRQAEAEGERGGRMIQLARARGYAEGAIDPSDLAAGIAVLRSEQEERDEWTLNLEGVA